MNIDYFVIFSAAVKPDGSPSGTLERRVNGAWNLSLCSSEAKFLVTGGRGKYGPTEAHVMKKLLLALGAEEHQIILEEKSLDTLDSVLHCSEIIKNEKNIVQAVTVCSNH